MTSTTEQRSARIYQFPAGGRAALGGQRDEMESAVLAANVPVAVAGPWYHEEAIDEAESARRSVQRFPGR